MPLIQSKFTVPPANQWNRHFQTIFPSKFRTLAMPAYERERLVLSDGDFVDLDWLKKPTQDKLVILIHGLEGSSHRPYMIGMAQYWFARGYAVCAWNCRSCSGEMNQAKRLYHHGEIEDLHEVISHAIHKHGFRQIGLIGFSMGGSILLKYMGVHGASTTKSIVGGVSISAPLNIKAAAKAIQSFGNTVYRNRFLKSLFEKIRTKAIQFPELEVSKLDNVKSWEDFDRWFSTPMNGYERLEDFYYQASCQHYIASIDRPALILTAKNDPMIPYRSLPIFLCADHEHLYLEFTTKGGHVGFAERRYETTYAERRSFDFLASFF